MTNGYNFYFKDGSDVLTLPITPSSLSISVGSKNKTITLINEGDINILKSPSLIEVSFDAIFPMRQYPYAREFAPFETYFNFFSELKEKKKSFRFIVTRSKPSGDRTWDTNLLVALEDFKLNEDANNGDDVVVSFKLKQFKEYGVKKLTSNSVESSTIVTPGASTTTPTTPTTTVTSTSTSSQTRSTESIDLTKPRKHTVIVDDTLWLIAKRYYGDSYEWKTIYNANKTAIEEDAKKHGKRSSSNGHWIFPGLVLVIPPL